MKTSKRQEIIRPLGAPPPSNAVIKRARQLCAQAGHPTDYVNCSVSAKLPKGQAQCHCLCGAKVVVVELPASATAQPGATIGGAA